MKEKIAKLIDVKSIMTLALTLVFCIMCFFPAIPSELKDIYLIIVGFYFGTQSQKKKEVSENVGNSKETNTSE